MYYEGVKYSHSYRGASVSRSGSMITGFFALQVLSILGSRGMSSDSSDRRPSIHPTVANKFNVFFLFCFNLSKEIMEKISREECPKRVLELRNNKE